MNSRQTKVQNIFLTGMPGCGKSSLGPLLAQYMGLGFVDLDRLIEQAEKKRFLRSLPPVNLVFAL